MTSALYEEFLALTKRIGALNSTKELLGWDQEVMMPKKEEGVMAQRQAAVAATAHELLTSERMGRLLDVLENEPLADGQRTNVVEMRRDYIRAKNVPSSLVEELQQTYVKAHLVWVNARQQNDFTSFAPMLAKVMELHRSKAHAINPGANPYEVLFNEFEPYMTLDQAKGYLAALKEPISSLLRKIQASQQVRSDFLAKDIPIDVQEKISRRIAADVGYDFEKGRLDVAPHPFTSGFRITTRYDDPWFGVIGSTIHESGHGIYEQDLPEEEFGTPLGQPLSLSVHESQSRVWENHLGRSRAFWKFQYPLLQTKYGLDDISFDEFYRGINKVEADHIRVNADELTYTLHILLRFEMEEALINRKIDVQDVPATWNTLSKNLLGIVPPTDALGCLQDVHWSQGYIGYFPTYALGNMIAAQLYNAAKRDIPDLEEQFEQGNCLALKSWMNEKIHRHGRRYPTLDLVERATGKPLGIDDYVTYLDDKFSSIYGL